jgi:prophage maintenance system killer protein
LATQKLKDHLIKGFTANKELLKQLRPSVELIKTTVSSEGIESTQVKDVVQVLSDFALGLDILDGYDHQKLEIGETNLNTQYEIAYSDAKQAILDLKLKFGGSNLFGNEKDQSFRSSIGAINQTFDGKELYPSIEEKAANLLYFVVKNHSFSDGNKRIAAWLFVWYLNKNDYLYNEVGRQRIENNALATLTLMVALSRPEEKDLMVKVIINSINKPNGAL